MCSDKKQIAVRMGSHRFNVDLAKTGIKCDKLIEMALRKCNMTTANSQTYTVFESSCGVERALSRDDIIVRSFHSYPVEFVIRKCTQTERKLIVSRRDVNTELREKYFRKLNRLEERQREVDSVIHVYERIEDQTLNQTKSELEYINKKLDEDQVKLAQNINVLKYLYARLTSNSNPNYKRLACDSFNSQTSLLHNDSDGYGSQEDSTYSGKSSRSSSSSALESLV